MALVADAQLPHDVKRVEYYRDQRLFVIVYTDPGHEGDLLNCEQEVEIASKIERSGNKMIVIGGVGEGKPTGYNVPLIQVGI